MRRLRANRAVAVLCIVLLTGATPMCAVATDAAPSPPRSVSLHLHGDAVEVMRESFAQFNLRLELAQLPVTPTLRIELDDADLSTVKQVLTWMTKMFFVDEGAGHVLAVEDNTSNRNKYRTRHHFSLEGMSADERTALHDSLSRVLGIDAATDNSSGFVIEGDHETLEQAGRLVNLIRRPTPDLLFKIRVYTITDDHESDIGAQAPSSAQGFSLLSEAEQLISSNSAAAEALVAAGLVSSTDTLGIALLLIAEGYTTSDLSNGFVYFGGGMTYMGVSFSSPSVNFLLTDTTLREIDETILRIADRQSGKLRIGESYPIKTGSSVYYSYSTSGSTTTATSTTTPSVEYQDMGITLEVSPRLLGNNQVYVNLDWKNQTVTNSTINEIPVLDRREFSSTMVIPMNATTLLTGQVGRKSVTDDSGLSSNRDGTRTDSDFLIAITPELAGGASNVESSSLRNVPAAHVR